MTVRVNKPSFNIREKLSELGRKFGLKGSELVAAETVQEARDLVSAGRKNIIINGAMEVAQRATSVTGSTGSGAYLTVDRFANHSSGATFNSSQETVPNGGMPELPIKFKKYLKFNVTTGANNSGIWQTIEDIYTVQGEHTFSFYARGTNPSGGILEIDARQYFNGSADVDSLIGTFNLTDTWKRYTFTFTPPSLSGKTIGANNYYRLFIRQPNSDNSTGAWHIDITGIQLEVGRNATEFEHRSYGEELALCQRYYQKKRIGYGRVAHFRTDAILVFAADLPVGLRASASSITQSSGLNQWAYRDGVSPTISSIQSNNSSASETTLTVLYSVSSGGDSDETCFYYGGGSILIDAEL